VTEETMKWLFNNGLAITILFAIGFGIWRGSNAFMAHILLPLKDAAVAHLSSTNRYLEATNETLEKTNQTMEKVCFELSDVRRDVAQVKANTTQCHGRNPS
jgi:cell division protein FtsB